MAHTPHTSDPAAAGVVLDDLAAARVADLAREYPASIRVFQRHRIDFCCGGRKSVAEAAARAGVDTAGLVVELEDALAAPGAGNTWLCALPASLTDLGKLIVGRYHVALRGELPRLVAMANRVEQVHGAEMPQILPPLAATVRALAAELATHMEQEEEVVFPAIERLERASRSHRAGAPGDLSALVAAREDEHAAAGEHLRTLRRLSSDFTPPEWACNTFRGLYHGLSELERELHEHIHLENNVLFPRALETAAHVVA
jgi:regulator of cell morphogenesis and NO signaling